LFVPKYTLGDACVSRTFLYGAIFELSHIGPPILRYPCRFDHRPQASSDRLGPVVEALTELRPGLRGPFFKGRPQGADRQCGSGSVPGCADLSSRGVHRGQIVSVGVVPSRVVRSFPEGREELPSRICTEGGGKQTL